MPRDVKHRERIYLDRLRSRCKDFPSGEIYSDESPDFIVDSNGKRIGIEITEIFVDDGKSKSSRQSIASARNTITSLARKHALELGTPPVCVTLFFNWRRRLLRCAEQDIASRVANVVHENIPPAGENADLKCRHDSIQPTEVDQILIYRARPVTEHRWEWTEFSRVEEDAIPYLKNAIERKSKQLRAFLKKCDECWLLIVSPSPGASGGIRPNEESLSHLYASPFARTYLWDDGRGELYPLKSED
jgi:CRISPR/Cas system-associated endoribonuclease Cas2